MASASFSRDEVILALDVLFSSHNGRVAVDSKEIADLSDLLNRLPIHPLENRREDFRNITGITRQINLYRTSCSTGKRDPNVGRAFFDIAFEYEHRYDELHRIAEAIRKNEHCYSIAFGCSVEDIGFPEGVLLGHLHRAVETRDGVGVSAIDACEICKLKPALCYNACDGLLEQHLLIPPTELDGGKKYASECFITVCSNCHTALHHYRPWRTRDNSGDVLR